MPGLIDIHSHFIPDWYADEARAAGIVDSIDGMPGWPAWSEEAHLALMNENGIERSMLSLSAPGVHFGDDEAAADLAHRTNDFALELKARHPDRFGVFASLPIPAVDASIAEAARVLDELGADGIAVKTNAHGVYLADASLEPLWSALDERSAVVFVHPTASPGAEHTAFGRPSPMLEYLFDTTRAFTDLVLSGVFERYPRIRWVAPHSGGLLPLIATRVSLFQQMFGPKLPGVRPNESTETLAELMPKLWFDLAGTPLPASAPALIQAAGHDHLLYGSDWCFTPPPVVAQHIAGLDAGWGDLTDAGWRDLTTRNAEVLLAPPTTNGEQQS
ncbi:amidohydrolase family protein [Subtercola lobariae]|uniref:6-methylsalicylate decarboxylase n=1 Tax=Subtercola lobariae TaxID=1588641 RepID=A0A917B4A1_9MICO|nr:amidohydrolase family protein [Subtercola lobariae]GGF22587.1 amidohydrolase [Subtercola lobariae]